MTIVSSPESHTALESRDTMPWWFTYPAKSNARPSPWNKVLNTERWKNSVSQTFSYLERTHCQSGNGRHWYHGSSQHLPSPGRPVLERTLTQNISRGSSEAGSQRSTGPSCNRHPWCPYRWIHLPPGLLLRNCLSKSLGWRYLVLPATIRTTMITYLFRKLNDVR